MPNYKLRNSQLICKTPSTCSWLIFNFLKNFFFCNFNLCHLLVGGQDRAYSFGSARNHNVYKGSCIGKNPFTVDLPVLKMIALSFDAHCKTPLYVLKNTHQCLRGYPLSFFLNSAFQIINCVDRVLENGVFK
jgi:hypothetical protein